MASNQKQNESSRRFIQQMDGYLQNLSRPVKVFAVSLCVVLVLFFGVWTYLNNKFLAPVDSGNTTPITVEIARGSSVSTIADKLEESGVIRNSTVFKLFVDIYDRGSKLKAGTYELNASMSIREVLDIISSGESSDDVVTVFLPEGATVSDLADRLINLGLIQDKNAFLEHMKDPSPYQEYAFIDAIADSKDSRIITMEGYLFPDTYFVYNTASEKDIIDKFLVQFNNVFNDEYQRRADELDMTVDEVITLASLIQKEAKEKDFAKVSAVFHNRLKTNSTLGSDVTVQYVLNSKKLNLSTEDIEVDSPYNTYKYPGLPPGPICNPGRAAIEAALWPDEDYIEQNMLYFCLADPNTNELVFAKTLEEHNQNVEKYRPLWEAYDAENGN